MASSIINQTRLIITKDNRLLVENKTSPKQKIDVKVNIGIDLFSNNEGVNIYDLEVDDFEAYWRRQYEHKVKEYGEETGVTKLKWTAWKPYPKDQIIFQGRTKNKGD